MSGGPNLLPLAGFHIWTVPSAAPEASSKNPPNVPNVTDSTWLVRMMVDGRVSPGVSGHSRIVPSSLRGEHSGIRAAAERHRRHPALVRRERLQEGIEGPLTP